MGKLPLAALAVAWAAAVCVVACATHGSGGGCTTNCGGDGGSPDGFNGDGPMLVGVDHGAPTGLVIQPASSTLTITDLGNLATAQLAAQITYTDGTSTGVPASWTIDRIDIASIGAGTGLVVPTGTVFGTINVTAQAQGLTGMTTLTVALQTTVNLSNIPSGDGAQLAGTTTPDPAVQLLAYPYDKTVFPRGLVAPEMMWNLSSAGDEYLVHYVAPGFDLGVLTTADPPSRFALQQSLWNMIVASTAGEDVKVELRRLSQGVAYLSTTQTWHIADANLRGLVYYWSIAQGQVMKADLTVGQVSTVFTSGSSQQLGTPVPLNASNLNTPPWEDNGQGDRCVACHSVSKDGSTLAGVFSIGGSEGPLGFVSLSTTQIAAIGDYHAGGMFTALTPNGGLAVMNTADKHMQLVDPTSGMGIPSSLDLLSYVCDPMFSPDGMHFALSANCDPTNSLQLVMEFRTADLVLYDFSQPAASDAGASPSFVNPRTIVPSTGIGDAIAFPSFSPDSSFLFFQRGDYSRAKYGTLQHGNDDLYVVPALPGATPIALDNANGASVLPPDNLHLNYAPTVNPVMAGGYIWVVFTSPRDYGNRMVSPELMPPMDATYANHKQLWVTAVDANIGATDPSHPAFWMPGQDLTTANMFGYWTLAPCKPSTGPNGPPTCETGFECCSGFCRNLGNGPVCTGNPGGCHQLGETCSADSDCCNAGATVGCVAGICQTKGTK